MKRFLIVIEKTKKGYSTYSPDLPGCIATARTRSAVTKRMKEAVEFHDIVTWGKLAEICKQLLTKGRKVYIEGRLQTRNWEGQDGVKRYKTEIVAENMLVLDRPKSWDGASGAPVAPADPAVAQSDADYSQSDKTFPSATATDDAQEGEPKTEVNLEDIPF